MALDAWRAVALLHGIKAQFFPIYHSFSLAAMVSRRAGVMPVAWLLRFTCVHLGAKRRTKSQNDERSSIVPVAIVII